LFLFGYHLAHIIPEPRKKGDSPQDIKQERFELGQSTKEGFDEKEDLEKVL